METQKQADTPRDIDSTISDEDIERAIHIVANTRRFALRGHNRKPVHHAHEPHAADNEEEAHRLAIVHVKIPPHRRSHSQHSERHDQQRVD